MSNSESGGSGSDNTKKRPRTDSDEDADVASASLMPSAKKRDTYTDRLDALGYKDVAYKVDVNGVPMRCLARIVFPHPSELAELVPVITASIRELDHGSLADSIIMLSCYRDESDLEGKKGHVTIKGLTYNPLFYQVTIPVYYVDMEWPALGLHPLVLPFDANRFLTLLNLLSRSKISTENNMFHLVLAESIAMFSTPILYEVSDDTIIKSIADASSNIEACYFIPYVEVKDEYTEYPEIDGKKEAKQHMYDHYLMEPGSSEHFEMRLSPQFISTAIQSAVLSGMKKSKKKKNGSEDADELRMSSRENYMTIRVDHSIETTPVVQCKQKLSFQFLIEGCFAPAFTNDTCYIERGSHRWKEIKKCQRYDMTGRIPPDEEEDVISSLVDRNRFLSVLGSFSKETRVTLCVIRNEGGRNGAFIKAERVFNNVKRVEKEEGPGRSIVDEPMDAEGATAANNASSEKWTIIIQTLSFIEPEDPDVRTLTDTDTTHYTSLTDLVPNNYAIDANGNLKTLSTSSWVAPE